jgi:hypothetical protein
MAMLCEIIGEQGVRRRCEGRLTLVIHTYVRLLVRRFLARATALPGPRENIPRGPRAPGTVVAPRAPRVPPQGSPQGLQLPRGQAWLVKLMQPSIHAFSQLKALPREPDPANPDATGTDPTGVQAKPPRKSRRRKFRFSRREDLLFRLRNGKPISEF